MSIHSALELAKAEIPFEHEKPTSVFYDGHVVGDYVTDLIVAGRLIVEVQGYFRTYKS